MRSSRLAATLIVIGPILVGCGGDGEDELSARAVTATRASAIQGGAPAKTQSFAVGIIGRSLCSATLIAPNLVLTARHCVERDPARTQVGCVSGAVESAAALRITTGETIGDGPYYEAKRVLAAPMHDGCGPDLAVIQLAKNVPAADATPARPAVDATYTSRSHFIKSATAIGYGAADDGRTGQRHLRENISILCVPGDADFDCGAAIDQVVQKFELVASAAACQGDSGGGLFDQATYDRRAPVLVATVSRGPVDAHGKCGLGVYVRVDRFAGFIAAAAKTAAREGGYEPPDWVDTALVADGGPTEERPDASADPATTDPAPITASCAARPSARTRTWTPLLAVAALVILRCLRRRSVIASRRRVRRRTVPSAVRAGPDEDLRRGEGGSEATASARYGLPVRPRARHFRRLASRPLRATPRRGARDRVRSRPPRAPRSGTRPSFRPRDRAR